MRIKTLWIDEFKNLRDFEINFSDVLTTVVIGANGTGKSNLLEALAVIFRDLDLELKPKEAMPFEYYIEYYCKGRRIEIDANPSQSRDQEGKQLKLLADERSKQRAARLMIWIDDERISMKQFFMEKRNYLPNHVFGYYSGPTNRLAQHFSRHQEIFNTEQRAGVDRPLRFLFFALPEHSQFVLLAFFSLSDESDDKFLQDYIGIDDLESVRFVIREPDWAQVDSSEDPFWGATGMPRQFLERLFDAAEIPIREVVRVPVRTGKRTSEEHLHLVLSSRKTLGSLIEDEGNKDFRRREFFKDLESLYISTMIAEVRISVKQLGTNERISFTELSEGEQQLLTVLGLLKFTRDSETLFLLDEPDTHLNPAWKAEYLRLIEPIVGDDTQCQILLATHDPIVIGSCLKNQVRVLSLRDGDTSEGVTWFEPDEGPRGLAVDALLTSDVYGLQSALDWVSQQKLDERRTLASKEPNELNETERIRLEELNAELEDLGITYSFRDPLYAEFERLMTLELDQQPALESVTLSKHQVEQRKQLAEEVFRDLEQKWEISK